jgi:hypothetical protein
MGVPITVAEWCEAWTVFVRSDAVIVSSNPASGMNIFVACELFYVSVQAEALRRADHPPNESYRPS